MSMNDEDVDATSYRSLFLHCCPVHWQRLIAGAQWPRGGPWGDVITGKEYGTAGETEPRRSYDERSWEAAILLRETVSTASQKFSKRT